MQPLPQNQNDERSSLASDLVATGRVGLSLVALIIGVVCSVGIFDAFTSQLPAAATVPDPISTLTADPELTKFLIGFNSFFVFVAGIGFVSAVRRFHRHIARVRSLFVMFFSVAMVAHCIWFIRQTLLLNINESVIYHESTQAGWMGFILFLISCSILIVLSLAISVLLMFPKLTNSPASQPEGMSAATQPK